MSSSPDVSSAPTQQPRKITASMWVSFWLAVATAVFIFAWAWLARSRTPFMPLLSVTGFLVGYAVAMFATPYTTVEKKQFSEFVKVVSGILTGFLLSKLGPLIDAFLLPGPNGGRPRITEGQVAEQVLITLASFLVAFLFVFGGRLYWRE